MWIICDKHWQVPTTGVVFEMDEEHPPSSFPSIQDVLVQELCVMMRL